MNCPKCGSQMNPNNKTKDTQPDWKCPNCKFKKVGSQWVPSEWPTAAWNPKPQGSRGGTQKIMEEYDQGEKIIEGIRWIMAKLEKIEGDIKFLNGVR